MGLTYVTTTIKPDQDSSNKYKTEFLVDTDAKDSLAPAKELIKAGIKPVGKMAYELANGDTVEYKFDLAEKIGSLSRKRIYQILEGIKLLTEPRDVVV